MNHRQTLVGFAGLGLVLFHFWFGAQRAALRPLWTGSGGTLPDTSNLPNLVGTGDAATSPGNALGTNGNPGGLLLPGGLGGYGRTSSGLPFPIGPTTGRQPGAGGLSKGTTHSQPNGLGGYINDLTGAAQPGLHQAV